MNQGTVITFYSYKGGVGRTFVMANVAVVLARWGYRVLCVDWDLEAPGLWHYFEPWLKDSSRGMLQFLETFVRTGNADWRNYSTPVDLPDMGNRLHVIHAGSRQDDYVKGVQDLHWARLYEERDLGAFLERVRDEWKSAFDFILVDSRTGITDIGGICTVQLPDILICALVANQQNLDGIVEISNRALKARSRLPYDRGLLLILPLVCRFDARDEYAAGQKWLGQLAESLAPLYHSWINDKVTPRDLIDRTTIPYFSIWSFGARLPVATESSANPEYVSYRIETIAALIGHSLARTDLLVESRDSYVAAARRAAQRGFRYDVFVSATEEARDLVAQLVTALNRRGITTFQVFAGNPVEAKRALSE
ncbi:MAG TPA: AAA family ATPase, partial [Thermoanaerobaculia bacterium]|nr:AAA family ATPase [Thermoanaerobaculia bacterium]